MSLINISVRHGRTPDDARARLEMAVQELRGTFGNMVRSVDWSSDRDSVRVIGTGFLVEMQIDAEHVHVSGDIPVLGALLGKTVENGVKQIVQQTFGTGPAGYG